MNRKTKLAVGLTVGVALLIGVGIALLVCHLRRRDQRWNAMLSRRLSFQNIPSGFELKGIVAGKKYAIRGLKLFDGSIALISRWVQNIGGIVVSSVEEADVQILLFGAEQKHYDRKTPRIVVSTEQASSRNFFGKGATQRLFCGAKFVWCMDDLDFLLCRDVYGVDSCRLCIAPAMLGSFLRSSGVCDAVERDVDVYHFGRTCHRRKQMVLDIKRKNRALNVVSRQHDHGDRLQKTLCRAKVVVACDYQSSLSTKSIHRIAEVLKYPHLKVVVERGNHGRFANALIRHLDPSGKRVIFAEFDTIPQTIETLHQTRQLGLDTTALFRATEKAFKFWHDWDGSFRSLE